MPIHIVSKLKEDGMKTVWKGGQTLLIWHFFQQIKGHNPRVLKLISLKIKLDQNNKPISDSVSKFE